jgi:SAM-dependent methyltransferase
MNNNLSSNSYWEKIWNGIELPAKFFDNYANERISDIIQKFISDKNYKNVLEIGGCPGRWAHYFSSKNNLICDSSDYNEMNVRITEQNYKFLGINGAVYLDDIRDPKYHSLKHYDIVISQGLIEHFRDLTEIFKNHLRYLNNGGTLIIGVPNIKNSFFYRGLQNFDKKILDTFRNVSQLELESLARESHLEILFCGYIGVFNLGLVNFTNFRKISKKILIYFSAIADRALKIAEIKKESPTFSPYIFLIAKK